MYTLFLTHCLTHLCCRYGLVTEQKKGVYKYFVDTGEGMEVANVRTIYVDEVGLAPFHLHLPLLFIPSYYIWYSRTNMQK
jgi:hypothetical protein